MQNDVKWLKELVMPEFDADLTDRQKDMLTQVVETFLSLWTEQLSVHDMSDAFRAELYDLNWIDAMKQSCAAPQLLATVLAMLKNLIIVRVGRFLCFPNKNSVYEQKFSMSYEIFSNSELLEKFKKTLEKSA
ncbi:unnamed protein product [Gongylonema pulchrum]|uniref:COMM domain-containing protein n=1 Tax=Gongylonema pulchrum TaxID=637853 RepID=A0A183EJQ2_9BILA|nr:unnamed protein product [Gongylonema pulchrum]